MSYKWESISGEVMAAAQEAYDLAGPANLGAGARAILSAAKAILAERERCAAVANERAAQLLAGAKIATPETRAAWGGQAIEALMIEQRIAQGHAPKQSVRIAELHGVTA